MSQQEEFDQYKEISEKKKKVYTKETSDIFGLVLLEMMKKLKLNQVLVSPKKILCLS